MTSANTDSWTRDPVADANPELPRKRERLSEEAETSPLTTDDSVVIEALSPEQVGTTYANAIELQDDTAMMPFSSNTLKLEPNVMVTPFNQVEFIRDQLARNGIVNADHVNNLAQWVIEHVENTRSVPGLWQEAYLDDADFYGKLGDFCVLMLESVDDFFEANSLSQLGEDALGANLHLFHSSITELSIRILSLLPSVVDQTITRRDSGQGSKTRQRIPLLSYVQILAQTAALHRAAAMSYLRERFHLKPKGMARERREFLLQHPTALSSLIQLLQTLARNHRELTNSWDAIDAILHVVHLLDLGAHKTAESVMEIAHMYILPVVCDKHPRALPDGFHEHLVVMAKATLSQLVKESDANNVALLYDRYIKSEADALLPQLTKDTSVSSLLKDISGGDRETLTELMTTAWVLQALKSFIFSDIMDVRSSGISQLSQRLLELYNRHRASTENFDHPVLQYVSRYMRTNELTKYIFGPNSHASLVSHSQNIIGFLAATFSYTDLETDIIWHACTHSVEAEFVKASFGVLVDLCRYLDLDHLLYLAKKYAITPPSKLGKDAVESLTDLFQKVKLKSHESCDQRQRLATAFISIDIMMRVNEAEDNQSLLRLRAIAKNELERFTDRSFTEEDRLQIYARCIPNITSPNEHATTSIDIVLLFLRRLESHHEAQDLLATLPPKAVVDELGHYVNSRRNAGRQRPATNRTALSARIELIVRLMNIAGDAIDEQAVKPFFQYTMGDLAWDNEARDSAWTVLGSMTTVAPMARIATKLLHRFIADEAVQLPLELVTPHLIKLLGLSMRDDADSVISADHHSQLLEAPGWRKLVEIAESTDIAPTNPLAMTTICEMLFDCPRQYKDRAAARRCHADFTRQQIQRICTEFATTSGSVHPSIGQKVALLNAIFTKSRDTSAQYDFPNDQELILATEPEDELVRRPLQVYGGGQPQPKVCTVQASGSTILSELAAKLYTVTGAVDNRVIVDGKSLDVTANGNQPLSQLGLQPSGVISVCPIHTSESDLDVVLPRLGAVEQEILLHYEELEALLDGPEFLAHQIYFFFTHIRPPIRVRQRLVSADTPINQICPPEDFARLGVAEEAFLLRGVHIIVAVLTDNTRPLDTEVVDRAIYCLIDFLHGSAISIGTLDHGTYADGDAELPKEPTANVLIADPASFARRLIDIGFFALQQSKDEYQRRRSLVNNSFKTLFQACRRQASVWQEFTGDIRVVDLHAHVLFDWDVSLASNASYAIKNFCKDSASAPEFADYYMKVVLALLPKALGQHARATDFFELATDVLFANQMLRSDETRVREITQSLVSALWRYEHFESVDLPVADLAVSGLIKLLTQAIQILKSFKKPLALSGLCEQLLERLLFPSLGDHAARPLIHEHSRQLVFRLVQLTCESSQDFAAILSGTSAPLQDANMDPNLKFPGHSQWLRPASKCSGLPNLGMTCYMNSLLQQLFANLHFRKFIFETPIVDSQRQAFLVEVQRLFAIMQDGCIVCPDTSPLARVLNIHTDSQEDVHGFYEDFLNGLEANMMDEQSKATLSRFFTGKLISQIKGECGHVSPRTEPFVDLPINVKNKACLSESLDEFVQGEPMEGANKYKCLACDATDGGRLVNAMKRACPEVMPDNLAFCLKRFTFEAMFGLDGKVNDRFEFPQAIDMSRYQRAHLDDPETPMDADMFELVGVIVHQGTLHLGHYWSYTLQRNHSEAGFKTWVKLEDRNVSVVQGGVEEVQHECFGGQRYTNGNERADNAYVLFYQRKSALENSAALAKAILDPISQTLLPPRTAIPHMHREAIHNDNNWRHRMAHLFDDDFAVYVEWLLATYPQHRVVPRTPTGPDCKESDEASSDIASDSQVDLVARMSHIVVHYLQRIAVSDPAPSRRVSACLKALEPLMGREPLEFCLYLLEGLTEFPEWFSRVLTHDNRNVRAQVTDLVLRCLSVIREHGHGTYHELFEKVKTAHARTLDLSQLISLDWAHYLGFASDLAGLGPFETGAVLDAGYWTLVTELLQVPHVPSLKKKFQGLSEHIKHNSRRVSALYNFLYSMLNGHVDLSEYSQPANLTRPVSECGAQLFREEMELFSRTDQKNIFLWMRSSRWANKDCEWKDSAPGKLLGLITSAKAPLQLMRRAEDSLLIHVEVEEESLSSILHLVLHFCRSCCQDHTAETAIHVFRMLMNVLRQWTGSEGDFAMVIADLYEMLPSPVLASMKDWVMDYLLLRDGGVREMVAKFLQEKVFKVESSMTASTDLEAERVRQARKLAARAVHELRNADDQGRSRTRYESCILVVQAIAHYLQGLHEKASEALEADDDAEARAKLGSALALELVESQNTIKAILSLEKDVLEHWAPESTMTTTMQNVRESVELVSDEVDSSEDWEEDDEESLR